MSVSRAFVIHPMDNVATALEDLEVGEVVILGESAQGSLTALEPVKTGHKLALKPFNTGDAVIKYGVVIGEVRRPCQMGEWMHLHNMKSRYDSRSNTFDPLSGAPGEKDVYR